MGRIFTGRYLLPLAIVLAWPSASPFARPDNRGSVLVGRVVDSASHQPLDRAIGFLENTPLGSSTDSTGEFRIRGIPKGLFHVVVARVGYKRATLDVTFGEADTLSLFFTLAPQLLPTTGMEITAERPSPSNLKSAPIYVPQESDGAYRYFGREDIPPIGITADDSSLYMYSLDTAVIAGGRFIRLWLLYKNLTDARSDFNPLKWIAMSVRAKGSISQRIRPAYPGYIKKLIDSTALVGRINSIIGGALHRDVRELRRLGADRGFETTGMQGFDFDWGRSFGIASPEKGGDVFANSANVGILSRFGVEAGASLNGFIFFPLQRSGPNGTLQPEEAEPGSMCSMELPLEGGVKVIAFELH